MLRFPCSSYSRLLLLSSPSAITTKGTTDSIKRCMNHSTLTSGFRRSTRISLATTRQHAQRAGCGRSLSSSKKAAEDSTQELVALTPGEKVVAGTRLTMWAGVAVFASVCGFYIGKELFPTKMSPNKVFDRAFDTIREHAEVSRRYGDPLKAYGRDHGGHREGRRNFIEHTEYDDKEDGSKRTRVRFNLEGQFGAAFVFAEVSSNMPSGEFVYILVQDKRNGQVTNVVDNRSALMAKRMAGGSEEGMNAFQNLLSGGGKSV